MAYYNGTLSGFLSGAVATYPNTDNEQSILTPGTYGDSTHVPQVVVGADGDISSITNVAIVGASAVVLDNAAATTYPTAPQTQGIWYGTNTKANVFAATSVCIGNSADCGAARAVSIGYTADSNNNYCVAIGAEATCTGGETATAVGYSSTAAGTDGTAFGSQSTAGAGNAAIGAGATATATSASAFGVNAVASVVGGTAVGTGATTNDTSHALGIAVNALSVTSAGLGVTLNGTSGVIPVNLTTQDEGVNLSTAVSKFNFVGAGVTAAGAGDTTTVTIPGGGAPSGAAGGDLSGTYPNPGVAQVDGVAQDYTSTAQGIAYVLGGDTSFQRIQKTGISTNGTPATLYTFALPLTATGGNVGTVMLSAQVTGVDNSGGPLPVDSGSLYSITTGYFARSGGALIFKQSSNQLLQGDGTLTGTTCAWSLSGSNAVLTVANGGGLPTDARWALVVQIVMAMYP